MQDGRSASGSHPQTVSTDYSSQSYTRLHNSQPHPAADLARGVDCQGPSLTAPATRTAVPRDHHGRNAKRREGARPAGTASLAAPPDRTGASRRAHCIGVRICSIAPCKSINDAEWVRLFTCPHYAHVRASRFPPSSVLSLPLTGPGRRAGPCPRTRLRRP